MEWISGKSSWRKGAIRTVYRLIHMTGVIGFGAMIGLASAVDSLHMKLLELAFLLLSLLLGLYIHTKSTHALIPYTLLIWTISPEIRRLLDWSFQSYSDTSIIMLTPYCVSLILLIPILKHFKRIDPRISMILKIIGAALIYGFFLGILKYRLSSVYELLNLAVPFLVLAYVHVSRFDSTVWDRWLRSFAYLAVIVGVYGIYQYLVLPPWDYFWMTTADMNSVGLPEPQKFRVFSLLNSPGPAGMFLGFALAIMIVQKKWRAFGIVGIMIVAFALLLTLVRVGWITCVIMIIAYFARSRLKSKLQLLTLGIIMVLAYVFILPALPGANQVTSRFSTLGSLEEDHSFNERLDFAKYIISDMITHPVGRGLGSSGLGVKLTQNSDTLAVFDNGYLNLFYSFGLPLGLAVIIMLGYLFLVLYKMSKTEKSYAPISFAAISATLFLLLGSNVLSGLTGYILMLKISLALTYTPLNRREM
ncbi:O-antigen ligase family protein [Paenibacillus sp. N3/727]|uniref:O-antigen ligase family protein n=1 Tax=Paenibacillus sp. N3/727 TaxID=2925845 RepID=UPI001F52CB52|nr:O-antigen ligase family protein [Paenibacillus sp. N3/727]UNK18763.1 O-antigen ligase family protein [Paenibacillus sp. N3/727]